jgi:protein phosphatase
VGAATSPGNRRRVNEDTLRVGDRYCLVADGMGGHVGGGVASAVAAEAIARHLDRAGVIDVTTVHAAVDHAHETVLRRALLDGTDGMGTTLVLAALAVDPEQRPAVAIAHVGDSRCYRYSGGDLRLLTADHSLVTELVASGRLGPAEAAAHPMAHVVTRAIGLEQLAIADVGWLALEPCRLLLCSDGVSDELPARVIGRVLAGIVDPQAAADRLIELALAGAALDNLTAVVVDVVPPSEAQ